MYICRNVNVYMYKCIHVKMHVKILPPPWVGYPPPPCGNCCGGIPPSFLVVMAVVVRGGSYVNPDAPYGIVTYVE